MTEVASGSYFKFTNTRAVWEALCGTNLTEVVNTLAKMSVKLPPEVLADRPGTPVKPAEVSPKPWMVMIAVKAIIMELSDELKDKNLVESLTTSSAYDSALKDCSQDGLIKTKLTRFTYPNPHPFFRSGGFSNIEDISAKLGGVGEGEGKKVIGNKPGDDGYSIRASVCALVRFWSKKSVDLGPADIFDNNTLKGTGAYEELKKLLTPRAAREEVAFNPLWGCDDVCWFEREAADDVRGRTFNFVMAENGVPDSRHNQLREIAKAVFSAESPFRIVNPYGSGRWGGLTALAQQLTRNGDCDSTESGSGPIVDLGAVDRQGFKCPLPIHYLPLRVRSVQEAKSTYPFLVRALHRFFLKIEAAAEGSQTPPPWAEPVEGARPLSDDDLADMVDAIRRISARHPAIILFDGYRRPSEREVSGDVDETLATLRRAIVDDQVLSLIERLCMPITPLFADLEGGAEGGLGQWRSRFVVFSNQPLYGMPNHDGSLHPLDSHPALKALNGISIEVSAPHPTLVGQLVEQIGLQCPGEIWAIGALRSKGDQTGAQGERRSPDWAGLKQAQESHVIAVKKLIKEARLEGFQGSESVLGTLSVATKLNLGGSGLQPPKKADVQAALSHVVTAILKTLSESKEERASWWVFFKLIALAPGGLRPRTLARVFQRFCGLRGYRVTDEVGARGEPPSLAKINRSILDMLESCHGILGLYRWDCLDGVFRDEGAQHRRNLPRVDVRPGGEKEEIQSERVIEFEFPEVQEAVLNRLHEVAGERQFLHHLLAEEALDQFAQVARYTDVLGDPTPRRYGRLFECLYHGAASLRSHALQSYDDNCSGDESFLGAQRALPDNPQQRWVKLYSFLYERILERAPDYRMARAWAADHLKADILKLLAWPQIAWGEQMGDALPTLAGMDDISSQSKRMSSFRVALLQAFMTIGELSREPRLWESDNERANGGGNIEGSTPDPNKVAGSGFDGKIEKRVFDCKISRAQSDDAKQYQQLRQEFTRRSSENSRGFAGALELLEKTRKNLHERIETSNGEVGPRRMVNEEGLNQLMLGFTHSELSWACDALNRVGEVAALSAELAYWTRVNEAQSTKSGGDPGRMFSLKEFASSDKEFLSASTSDFLDALTHYHLSDTIRRRLLFKDPTARSAQMGGHSGRNLIRVCLKLERLAELKLRAARPAATAGETMADGRYAQQPGWFWHQAHRIADEMGLHLASFPRERAGLQVLEASMVRHSCLDEDRQFGEALQQALECLQIAEREVIRLGMHSRLRMRFALERAKILMAYAKLGNKQGKGAQSVNLALTMALDDLEVLVGFTKDTFDQVWRGIVLRQIHKIKVATHGFPEESDLKKRIGRLSV